MLNFKIRWRELQRKLKATHYVVGFIVVVVAAMVLPHLWLDPPTRAWAIGSRTLQLAGLFTTGYALAKRGSVFHEATPWVAAIKWLESLPEVLLPPKPKDSAGEFGEYGIRGADATTQVVPAPHDVPGRLDALDQGMADLQKYYSEVRDKLQEGIREQEELRNQFAAELQRIENHFREAMVGSYRQEWLGVAWFAVGFVFDML